MKKPEILSPVGSMASLYAAIEGGCDAVYLAGKLFGARAFADNFSNEELIFAINYAHKYGVKVYVTTNTLVYDSEIPAFMKYIEFLYTNNVDAIIIQDIGMFDLVHKTFPDLEIHISTQMHIHNQEGVELVKSLGASRVVLARETPIDLVKKIRNIPDIELEIFVHGALCISYSGQCLMSSLIGGRSGNRGTCAQCCRQPYELFCNDIKISKDNYLLSTRDLCTIEHIRELIEAGVDSLKIEGRMKRPEYVYLVTKLYRKAVDSYIETGKVSVTEEEINDLKKIFNRNYTKGFLFNTSNDKFMNTFRPNHMGVKVGNVICVDKNRVKIRLLDNLNLNDGIRFVKNGYEDVGMNVQQMFQNNNKVTSAKKNETITLLVKDTVQVNSEVLKTTDYNQLKELDKIIQEQNRKVNVDVSLKAHLGSPLEMTVSDGKHTVTNYSEYIVDKAMKNPTSYDDIKDHVFRTGNTIYNINIFDLDYDDNIFIPIKTLNDLRRDSLEKLEELRIDKPKIIEKQQYNIDLPDFEHTEWKILYLSTYEDYHISMGSHYNEVIIPYNKSYDDYWIRYNIPRVQEYISERKGNVYVSDLGSVYKFKLKDMASSYFMNVTNAYSVALLHSLGVRRVALSIEMNDYQIKSLINNYEETFGKHPNVEVVVDTLPESMIIKYDLFNGKYDSKNDYYLKDKFGNKFKVIRRDNFTVIFNHERLIKENPEYLYELGVNALRYDK